MPLQKTNTAPELWQLTHNWLLLLGNKPNTKFCREEITTHPDYPAMTAVTDFLEAGNMRYNAVQADASYIHEFNYPLLAHIRQTGQEYLYIIHSANDWEKHKQVTQYWSGIVIYSEKDSKWQNNENSQYHKNNFKNKIFSLVLILLGCSLFIYSVFTLTSLLEILFGCFSLIGLIISITLLATELGYRSQVVKHVCGAKSKGGCMKVLQSSFGNGILGITPADASVLYFSSQFIIFLISTSFANLFQHLFLLSYLGILVVVWSIYTQAVKLRQWCALCLGIAAILILQVTLTSLMPRNLSLNISLFSLFFPMLFVLFLIILLPIKNLLKSNRNNKQKLSEFKKWKTDLNLFLAQWEQKEEVNTEIWENDLILGDKTAPILITVACNPYCKPCSLAHLQLEDLLNRYGNKINVQMRLICDIEYDEDRRTIAVKAILQKAAEVTSVSETRQMISDWFNWMDIDKWLIKWESKTSVDVSDNLFQHFRWIEESSIQFTPTFFINGKEMPNRYNLNDLEFLIPRLSESFSPMALR